MKRDRVLLIEDEESTAFMLKSLLGSEYEVDWAASARAGLEHLRTGRANDALADLILLDIRLPDVDGLELCRQIKSTPEFLGIPVLFLTSQSSSADETKAFEIGAVDYITKPFTPAVVRARVRTHMELKKSRDELERLAFIDGLTGLYNRRAFDDAFAREWRRHLRTGDVLSVILMDVDHFKQYNDTYGHGAGDDCLRLIGKALREGIQRPGDVVARYGGEEFVMLLPGTSLDGAFSVARAVGASIASLKIPHSKSSAGSHVTLSLGVATCAVTREADPQALLKAADQKLYAAKAAGRNRVMGTLLEQRGS
ncbi:MAG: diguanylate cyclase [Rhodospirillaceae bacterium]|nr:diguanylate cyclase [Rhodospirillaceae bacterium]